MNKQEYTKQLKSKNWFNKRKEILERDKNTCINCGSKDNLEIHHTYYRIGFKAWQYPNSSLHTLCGSCHYEVHLLFEIPIKPKKKPKKKKKKGFTYNTKNKRTKLKATKIVNGFAMYC